MGRPDFAITDLSGLAQGDLAFIIENFPQPGRSYEEIAQILDELPSTLESTLSSDYLFQQVCGRAQRLLAVSPFLLFNVLLRRTLTDHRAGPGRKVTNYLANMLALFVRTERLYRIEPYDRDTHEYLVEMMEEAREADARRQFLIYSHIGNYALFLTGLFPQWIDHRYRSKRRPIDAKYYVDMGSTHFHQAAAHGLARVYGLDDVFLRLSLRFEHYKSALNHIASRHLFIG